MNPNLEIRNPKLETRNAWRRGGRLRWAQLPLLPGMWFRVQGPLRGVQGLERCGVYGLQGLMV